MPTATIASLSVTGDVVLGPGAPITLVKGLPTACLGDMVTGALCVSGVVSLSIALNDLACGRPKAHIGSMISGVSPIGIPMATAIGVTVGVTELV
jgi:hypothetical protein